MRGLSCHGGAALGLACLVLLTSATFGESGEGHADLLRAPAGSRIVVTLTTGGQLAGTIAGVRDGRLVLDLARSGERGRRIMEIPVDRIEAFELIARAAPTTERVAEAPSGDVPRGDTASAGRQSGQTPRTQPAATQPASRSEAEKTIEARLALLAEFPPTAGWSVERWRKLADRIYLRNMHPGPREKRFMEVLPEWLEGVALLARKERGEDLTKPLAGPSGAALLTRFPPGPPPGDDKAEVLWSDARYAQLRERVFVEKFDLWLAGQQLAAQDADQASLGADERDALAFYTAYPEAYGWGQGRRNAAASKHAASVALTEQERMFVALYPNWTVAQAAGVAAEQAERAPTISYDNMAEFEYDRDMPDENVSSENVRTGGVGNDNVVPVTRDEEN